MNSTGGYWKHVIRCGWYFNCCCVMFEESFLCLFLCVMGKAADLSNFDRGQIILDGLMAENEYLWKCTIPDLSMLVLMQSGWMMVKPAIDTTTLDVYLHSTKKDIRDCTTWWSKIGCRQWLTWQPNIVQVQV